MNLDWTVPRMSLRTVSASDVNGYYGYALSVRATTTLSVRSSVGVAYMTLTSVDGQFESQVD